MDSFFFEPIPSPSSFENFKKPHESISPTKITPQPPPREQTILYLAYGSNLCAKTFLGCRGIRPISATNVVVPELVLTFDLPGIAYLEPCFANAQFKALSVKTSSSSPFSAAGAEESPLLRSSGRDDDDDDVKPPWKPNDGLMGVVYEVSRKDSATIIATEFAGLKYQVVQISAYPIDGDGVASGPLMAAYTLVAQPGQRAEKSKSGRPPQPSKRYLGLIQAGALEHELPSSYRQYLDGLESYRRTTWRQRMGAGFNGLLWIPVILSMTIFSKLYARENRIAPKWMLKVWSGLCFFMWAIYDYVFCWMFGDGERTAEDG